MKRIRQLALGLALSLAGISGVVAAGRPLTATLAGAAEVPKAGDPNGTGAAYITVNLGQGTLCYELFVENITLPATVAHVHPGTAGTANPPVIDLNPPDETGHSSGCAPAPKDLLKAILKNPEAFYVNVHNRDFPGGAIRGQLSK